MDLREFAADSKVKILIGKGGVGKTTVTCTLARALAGAGLRVLIVELEGRPEVARSFGIHTELSYEPEPLYVDPSGGLVSARLLTSDEALLEYLDDHGLGRISRRLLRSGVLDVVAGAIPGIRDVLVLGKIKQISNEQPVDVVLVDAPATGHAVTLLTSAAGLAEVARSGPVRHQAEAVVEMLSDPGRCSVLLVTLPEELPVSETIEAAFTVEDRAGVSLGPLICNLVDLAAASLAVPAGVAAAEAGIELDIQVITDLDQAAAFQRHRAATASSQLDRLRRELPLPAVKLPRLAAASIGPAELELLAHALAEGLERLPGGST